MEQNVTLANALKSLHLITYWSYGIVLNTFMYTKIIIHTEQNLTLAKVKGQGHSAIGF